MMKEKLEQIKAEAVAKIQEADVPEKLSDHAEGPPEEGITDS